jgi:hypothetical protein
MICELKSAGEVDNLAPRALTTAKVGIRKV